MLVSINNYQSIKKNQINNGWLRAKIEKSFFGPFQPSSAKKARGTLRCQACPTHRVCPFQQRDYVNMVPLYIIVYVYRG